MSCRPVMSSQSRKNASNGLKIRTQSGQKSPVTLVYDLNILILIYFILAKSDQSQLEHKCPSASQGDLDQADCSAMTVMNVCPSTTEPLASGDGSAGPVHVCVLFIWLAGRWRSEEAGV